MLKFNIGFRGGKVYMNFKETRCVFKEDTHQYFLVDARTGEVIKELISVTTLMKKHEIAPNYNNVPTETLKAKAEYGSLVHKELENYIKDGEIGFSQELQDFIDWQSENDFAAHKSEFIVYNDIVAGTVDLLGEQRLAIDDSCNILGDFKTTATLHEDAVSWQLSIYAYLYKRMFGGTIDALKAFHFNNGLNVVDIKPKPVEEIEKLLEAEANGEKYEPKQLEVAEVLLNQVVEAEEKIKNFELLKKEVEKQADVLRQQLMDAMKQQGIKTFDNGKMRITYTPPTTRETPDNKRLAEEMPEIAKKYTKVGAVKEKLTITIRKEGK